MAAVQLCLMLVLLGAHVHTEPLPCPDINDVTKNNWPEDRPGYITSAPNAAGVISVYWAPYNNSVDYIDVTDYVTVTFNESTQAIDFTALPTMAGVRNYPAKGYPQQAELGGNCEITCASETKEFQFIMTVTDQNTATPAFASPTYSVEVSETFPVGLTIPGLSISASDADADQGNYELSFTLQEGSPFNMTEAVKTSDLPPTYTTQLVLNEALDFNTQQSYQLTVTATDPGGLSADTAVTVTVVDMDTMQPEFEQSVYTVTIDDPESLGPLNVSIEAFDPDAPGKLTYELQDSSGGQFTEYFALDPDTAQLNLTKDITDLLEPYTWTIPFLLQATEDGGYGFSCRAELLIILPGTELTTTTGPTPWCPAMSSVIISSWPEDQTGSIVSRAAPGVTQVAWAPYNSSSDYLDVSRYVDVTVNTDLDVIEFTALPTMYGIVDFESPTYPDPVMMKGTCLLKCGTDRDEFHFTLYATDANTACPVLSSASYTVHVTETFPVGLVIGTPVISATDADADVANYELSFAMQEDSPFSLTEAVKTSDLLPTYMTQLVLDEPLNYATNSSYKLTITAQDPKGQQSDATIRVNVIEVDTAHPELDSPSRTSTGDTPE